MKCKKCGSQLHWMVEGCWKCIQKQREFAATAKILRGEEE